MARQCLVVAILTAAMMELAGNSANAELVDTKVATLVKSGSTITLKSDYVLMSKWSALGALAYMVISLVLIAYLIIRWYKHHNLPLHLISTIGLAAIGTPPALNILLPRFGIAAFDGSLNYPAALLGSVAIVGIVSIHWKNTDAKSKTLPTTQPIPPSVNGVGEPDPLRIPNLSQAIAAAIVEKGMPLPEDVVKCLIDKIETMDGEDAYKELPERLRKGVCNIVLNQHSNNSIIQGLIAAAPLDSPLDGTGYSLVANCRMSAHNKIHAFIVQVENFTRSLAGYRDRAAKRP